MSSFISYAAFFVFFEGLSPVVVNYICYFFFQLERKIYLRTETAITLYSIAKLLFT